MVAIPQFSWHDRVVIHRVLVVGLVFACWASLPAQELRVLHITITVTDADGRDRPVPRHALLVSDNPPTGAPRRVVTSLEGRVDVRLRPGNYTIESDEPLVYQGKSYQWMRILDVPADRDATLTFTDANADVADTSRSATMAAGQLSPSELLMTWQGNVVNLWSDTARGAGFVLDRRGLILTNAQVVGTSDMVEVQFTATKKVAGRVLAADRTTHVAVIWIDPSLVSALPPAKLAYRDGAPALAEEQDVFTIDASLLDQKTLMSGRVVGINGAVIETDLRIDDHATGVPILAANGAIIGITSGDDRGHGDAVRIDVAATMLAAAEEKMAATAAPKTTHCRSNRSRPRPTPGKTLCQSGWRMLAPTSSRRRTSTSPSSRRHSITCCTSDPTTRPARRRPAAGRT